MNATTPEPAVSPDIDPTKTFATLQAEFALAGHELVRMADGSLLVSRWGLARPLASIEEARTWLARVTGTAA